MIDDIKLIERMDKLLELGMGEESKNWTPEQNLYFVMGAVKGIKSNAESRLKEFEEAHEPSLDDMLEYLNQGKITKN